MRVNKLLCCLKSQSISLCHIINKHKSHRGYHGIPFIDFYQRTTGETVSDHFLENLRKKHPNIPGLSHDRLQCSLQILDKFNITPLDACQDIHVFSMNPITMDNYGEILKECGFIKILPKYIIRYHTLVKSRTLAQLKKQGLIRNDLDLEQLLHESLPEWPSKDKILHNFPDANTNILAVRLKVLESYLGWRLYITPEQFANYCRHYLPLKHKPMADIKEALNIAENDIKFDLAGIRKNGFIIAADPINTKLTIDNVPILAGMDIREVIKIEPAILKNNYNGLIKIRNLLEEYRIPEEAQRKCLKVYCMCPKTIEERLKWLKNLKEYQILKSNPRILYLLVHQKKMVTRLERIKETKKNCYSLNHLVSSHKVFSHYIDSFGSKVCARDLEVLVSSSLGLNEETSNKKAKKTKANKLLKNQLKRHKYYLHSALNIVDENIDFLKRTFSNQVIFNNCQLLLYPLLEIQYYLDLFTKLRENTHSECNQVLDISYNNLQYGYLTDDQILSLVLYEIEKKYHFSGDGIWARQDGVKIESQTS